MDFREYSTAAGRWYNAAAMNFCNPRFLRSGWTAADAAPAVVFAGRSNAGKSSALNALCGGRFARAAKAPGRTRMINLFELAGGRVFADLPGYGYAAVSRGERRLWGARITRFLRAPQIVGAVLVADCRRGLGERDAALLALADGLPALVLMNKIDKLNRDRARRCVVDAREQLAEYAPSARALPFSALKKDGVCEAREIIAGFFEAPSQ